MSSLHLATRDTSGFGETFLNVANIVSRVSLPDLVLSSVLHLRLLSSAMCEDFLEPYLTAPIAECIAELTRPGSNSHQLHDAALLKKCPDHNKLFVPENLDVSSCNAFALPTNCINLRKVSAGDNIVGYLDTEMLRGTSDEMREGTISCRWNEGGRLHDLSLTTRRRAYSLCSFL